MMSEKRVKAMIPFAPSPRSDSRLQLSRLIKWVWSNSKSNSWLLGLAVLCAAGISSLSAMTLLYARNFIDVVSKDPSPRLIVRLMFVLLCLFVSAVVLRLVSKTLEALASTNIRTELETSCFKHLSGLRFEYLADHSAARLTAAIMGEIPLAAGIVGVILRSFIRAPLTIILVMAVLFWQAFTVAVVILITSPLLLVGLGFFSKSAKKAANAAFETLSKMYGELNEQLIGIRTVTSLGMLEWFSKKLADYARQIARASRKAAMCGVLQQTTQELISTALLVGLLLWLSWQVSSGKIDLSRALLVPATAWICRDEVLKIGEGYLRLRKTEGAVLRLTDLLNTVPMKDGNIALDSPISSVCLENVTFKYPNSEVLFKDANLELRPGLTIITGESGSGKSTLCDICLRFHVPTSGAVYYNGIPISNLTEQSLRQNTATVEQEPYLFEGSIRYNLALGRDSVTADDMLQALELACVDDVVGKLPGRIDFVLAQNAGNLSMGQRQRIATARAILRRPTFLVLDEFTSGLDEETERRVLKAILELSSETIVLCTTHRATVVRHADAVYRIRNKKLEKLSCPDDLVKETTDASI